MEYVVVKWLHILSSTLLFGTGLGTAFYMFFVARSRQPLAAAIVNTWVVRADWLFTGVTGVFQPLSGWYLAHLAGIPMTSRWIVWSFFLYGLALCCWLPVVWIQYRLRDIARAAAAAGQPLGDDYWRLQRIWVLLGIPAFAALVTVFYLMVAKPT